MADYLADTTIAVTPAGVVVAGTTITVIVATGAGTYTTPVGVTAIQVEGVGGGGGGGGAATNNSARGAGGGGSGYFRKYITGPAATYAYSVGSGGAGGLNTGATGSNGTATNFGGGLLIGAAGSGGGGATAAVSAAGGVGGGVVGGDLAIIGQAGADSIQSVVAGDGGGSHFGFGARGSSFATASAGVAGSFYGGGGSGAVRGGGTNEPGGDGANGILIVTEFRP